MTTATDTDTDVLAGLDYDPVCEATTVVTTDDMVLFERPPQCTNPADVLVTIHNFRGHTYRQKLLCLACLARVGPKCYAGCGARNITSITNLGRPKQ